MSKLQSYVTLTSADVIERCDYKIKDIDDGRLDAVEKAVQNAMKPRERFFLLRWFGAKPLVRTREEAEAVVNHDPDGWGSRRDRIMMRWERHRQHCERLKELAETSPDGQVNLTAKDLAGINGEDY